MFEFEFEFENFSASFIKDPLQFWKFLIGFGDRKTDSCGLKDTFKRFKRLKVWIRKGTFFLHDSVFV